MKRISVFIVFLISAFTMKAQHEILPFFDQQGKIRLETVELDTLSKTLVTISHRADDVVWSRVVYRIIDMRYKQNYPLYFPIRYEEGVTDRSLFRIMTEAIADGMPFYSQESKTTLTPEYNKVIEPKKMAGFFTTVMKADERTEDNTFIDFDSVANKLVFSVSPDAYPDFVKNQLKFLIQEVVFFNKHTSRLHSKIIGIAPMYAGFLSENMTPRKALGESVLGWVLYDDLRPYLAKHYVKSDVNGSQDVTFEQFFAQQLYTSYLVGADNIRDRIILDYTRSEAEVHKEQQKLEDELLNFEQDLWEY